MELELKYSSLSHFPLAKEISEASFSSSYLWARGKESVRKYLESGNILLAFVENQLAGWIIIQKLNNDWIRLNTVYVKKEFRKAGIAKKMITRATEDNLKKNIYISNSNEKFFSYLSEIGFRKIKITLLPPGAIFAIAAEGFKLKTILKNLRIYKKHKIFHLAKLSKKDMQVPGQSS